MGFNLKLKSEVKQIVIDKKLRRINTNTAKKKLNDIITISKMSIVDKGVRDLKNDVFQAKKELNIQGPLSADMQRPERKIMRL